MEKANRLELIDGLLKRLLGLVLFADGEFGLSQAVHGGGMFITQAVVAGIVFKQPSGASHRISEPLDCLLVQTESMGAQP